MPENKPTYLWFKRRRYGFGWVPVTWQGFLILGAYAASLILLGTILLKDVPEDSYQAEVGIFLTIAILSPLLLWLLVRNHAPTPKWRWGLKPDNSSEEDF